MMKSYKKDVEERRKEARAWLHATFYVAESGSVTKAEVYAAYLCFCHKYRREPFNRAVFGRQVVRKGFLPTSTICYFLLLCDVVCLSFLRSSVFSLVFPSLLSVAFFSFFLLIFALFFSNQHHVHTDALFFQSFRCYSREGKEAEGT